MKRLVWLAVIGGVLLAVLLLALSFIGPLGGGRGTAGYGPWMMGRGMSGYGSWGAVWGLPLMGIMAVGMFIPWVLVIIGVVWLVQVLARNSSRSASELQVESPVDILKKRYAQGEISKEQFEETKGALRL